MSRIPKVINIQIPIVVDGNCDVSNEAVEAFRQYLLDGTSKIIKATFERYIKKFGSDSIRYHFEEADISLGGTIPQEGGGEEKATET